MECKQERLQREGEVKNRGFSTVMMLLMCVCVCVSEGYCYSEQVPSHTHTQNTLAIPRPHSEVCKCSNMSEGLHFNPKETHSLCPFVWAECCLRRRAGFNVRRSLEMQMHEMIKCKQVSGEMCETIKSDPPCVQMLRPARKGNRFSLKICLNVME